MNNTLTIRLKKSADSGTHTIDTGYNVKVGNETKKRYLNDRLEVIETSPKSDKGSKFDITLNATNLWTKIINLNGEGLDLVAIKGWAKDHPLFNKAGETGHALYVYEFSDEIIEEIFEDDEEITEVRTKFGTLEKEQVEAVSVNFGYAPWGVDEKSLKNALVGLKGGIITQNASNRSEFLHSFDSIMDEYKLNFKSAVQCGVINLTNEGVYTFNGEVLGSSQDQSVLMLKQRKDLYSAVSRDLVGKGKFFATKAKMDEVKEEVKQVKAEAKLAEDFEDMNIATKGKGKPAKPVAENA